MSSLLWYIPGAAGKPRPAELAAQYKLGSLFERLGEYTWVQCQRGPAAAGDGPAGDPGVIITAAGGAGLCGFYPDRQRWRTVPDAAAGVMVGLYSDDVPGPTDLARPDQIDGHLVTLGDGHDWLIPVARRVDAACTLPRSVDLTDDGRWVEGDVKAAYAPLWAAAQRFWDHWMSAGQVNVNELGFDDLFDLTSMALACNYRINRAAAALLGLFDVNITRQVLLALIDWPSVLLLAAEADAEKKTGGIIPAAACSNTDCGDQAEPTHTSQLSPISTCSDRTEVMA